MTGEPQWVPGNRAIPLGEGMPPTALVSGSLAVFAVDRETGQRLHLFPVSQGDVLLPAGKSGDSMWEIVAVPLETSCLATMTEPDEWERGIALENWLTKLGGAMVELRPPGEAQVATAGRSLLLKAGQRLAVEEGIAFLRGEKVSLLGVPVEAGATVALVPGLWAENAGANEWEVTPLENGDCEALALAIGLTTGVLFEALDEVKERRATADQERFAARQELNRRVSARALGDLAAIAGDRRAPEPAASGADPLFEAFRVAAAALGATARPARAAGARADAVREIAQASGMRTRTVIMAGEWWAKESGVFVAHRDNGNPVALVPLRGGFGRGYEIYDPVAGTREKASRSTAADLGTFAQMLYRPLPEDLSAGSLFRYAIGTGRRDVRTVLAAGAGAAILAMAAPQGFAILIGQAIPDADRSMVWQVGGGILAAALGSAIFLLAQAIAILRLQSTAFMALQTGVWDYLLKLSPAFFRGFTAGQLRLRADAVTRMHQLLTADALRSLFAGAAGFLSLALILWYSPAIALIAFASGAAIALHTWFRARALFAVQQRWQDMEELLSGLVLQSINAVSKLRVAGAQDRAFSRWAREYSQMEKLALAIQEKKDAIRLFNVVVPALATALTFFYLLRQSVALGAFLACSSAMTAFLAAVAAAGDSVAGLVLAANKWQQVRTILAVQPEVDGSKTHPGRLRGAVRVENLRFRYRSDGPMILDDVSIDVAPGECIALTGPSGSGKSTLLNLMLRFETPHSGAIFLDGRELSGLDITAVRRQIGVVTQDGRIMAGSLFDNICCGGLNTMDEAWEAARAAGLGEDIEAMAMGMHTVVSEGGGNLSGGAAAAGTDREGAGAEAGDSDFRRSDQCAG